MKCVVCRKETNLIVQTCEPDEQVAVCTRCHPVYAPQIIRQLMFFFFVNAKTSKRGKWGQITLYSGR